ncbi:MAG: hypothetical protein ACKPBT_21830, partial [Microcystis aeruginosa]
LFCMTTYQLSVISYQLSVISYQLSVISHQLSAFCSLSPYFPISLSPYLLTSKIHFTPWSDRD